MQIIYLFAINFLDLHKKRNIEILNMIIMIILFIICHNCSLLTAPPFYIFTSLKMNERRKSKRFDSEKPASSRTGAIPVFGLVDLKKNRDFRLIKQDLEERGRMRDKVPGGGPKEEVLYVDATRNVGVVLGKTRNKIEKCRFSFKIRPQVLINECICKSKIHNVSGKIFTFFY